MSLAPLAPFAETTARQVVDHVSAAVGIAMHGLRSAERIGPLADLMSDVRCFCFCDNHCSQRNHMGYGLRRNKVEGGSGGKRGHSNMTHWEYMEEIKQRSRKARRRAAKALEREARQARK